MHHRSISCTKISLKSKLILAWNFFLLLFLKDLVFGNFGCHYCHESQIFDQQLHELPNLQYLRSVDRIPQKILFIIGHTIARTIATVTEDWAKRFLQCDKFTRLQNSFFRGKAWKPNLWITYHPSVLSSGVRDLKQAVLWKVAYPC
jgi:hypothetical protein